MSNTINNNTEQYNVLLIGNNPIELNSIYERLRLLKHVRFIAEIAFDLKSALSRKKFKPSFIIIDDNLGKDQMNELVHTLSRKKEMENVPITILKNSNTGESFQEAQEYILKQNADGERLSKALLNSLRMKNTQELLRRTYYKNKRKLKKAINGF